MKFLLHTLLYLLIAVCHTVPLPVFAQQTTQTEQQSDNDILPPALSEELKRAENMPDSRFLGEFMNMLFTLGIIVVVIMILMWILKRMINVRVEQVNKTSTIKVLEKRVITPKTTVYVLGVFGKAVAITESLNGVTLLSEFSLKQIQDEMQTKQNPQKK